MSLKVRNLAVLGGLAMFVGAMAYLPQRFVKGKKVVTLDQPLTGSQIQRGPYINSGSRDIGPDPDWNLKEGTYKGRRPM